MRYYLSGPTRQNCAAYARTFFRRASTSAYWNFSKVFLLLSVKKHRGKIGGHFGCKLTKGKGSGASFHEWDWSLVFFQLLSRDFYSQLLNVEQVYIYCLLCMKICRYACISPSHNTDSSARSRPNMKEICFPASSISSLLQNNHDPSKENVQSYGEVDN